MPASPPFTAQDTARLRRGLVEFMADPERGPVSYAQMIVAGRQPIRPPGPPGYVGKVLADCERRRLEDARLWFVDDSLCQLIEAAAPTMPGWAPSRPDLPSEAGFVLFERAITLLNRDAVGVSEDFINGLLGADPADEEWNERMQAILDAGVHIVGASWSPLQVPGITTTWADGGVWITFYAESAIGRTGMDDDTARLVRQWLPPLTPDNESIVAWCPPGEPDPERYVLPRWTADGSNATTTGQWAALLFSTFRLARQPGLGVVTTERVERAERRRAERAGLPARDDIQVVRLHTNHRPPPAATTDADEGGKATRVYRHRWMVSGYWRPKDWQPGQPLPDWVKGHVKGPKGAPFLKRDKVIHLTDPSKGGASS